MNVRRDNRLSQVRGARTLRYPFNGAVDRLIPEMLSSSPVDVRNTNDGDMEKLRSLPEIIDDHNDREHFAHETQQIAAVGASRRLLPVDQPVDQRLPLRCCSTVLWR